MNVEWKERREIKDKFFGEILGEFSFLISIFFSFLFFFFFAKITILKQ